MLSARRLATISGGGTDADLDVGVGIEAVLRHVVAQQVVVHRVVERHRELEALPLLRIALVLVLDGQRDGLAVDVLDRRHACRGPGSSPTPIVIASGIGESMWAASYSLLMVLSRIDGPAGGLDHLDVEAVLAVEAHRVRHDDRRGAGDRDEADLEVLLLRRGGLGEHFRRQSRAGRTARSPPVPSRRRPRAGTPCGWLPPGTARARRPTRRRATVAHPRSPQLPRRARPAWRDDRSRSRLGRDQQSDPADCRSSLLPPLPIPATPTEAPVAPVRLTADRSAESNRRASTRPCGIALFRQEVAISERVGEEPAACTASTCLHKS